MTQPNDILDKLHKQQDAIAKAHGRRETELRHTRMLTDYLTDLVQQNPEAWEVVPAYVHGHATRHDNVKGSYVFELVSADGLVRWREITAHLMGVFPPCQLLRFKDSCPSFVPELRPRQQASLEAGKAQCQEVVPFTITLDKTTDYPGRASVVWYSEASLGRLRIEVRVVGTTHGGPSEVGYKYEKVYAKRNGHRVLIGYEDTWPFRRQHTVCFSAPQGQANRLQAWWGLDAETPTWDASGDTTPSAAAVFMNLTTPKAV